MEETGLNWLAYITTNSVKFSRRRNSFQLGDGIYFLLSAIKGHVAENFIGANDFISQTDSISVYIRKDVINLAVKVTKGLFTSSGKSLWPLPFSTLLLNFLLLLFVLSSLCHNVARVTRPNLVSWKGFDWRGQKREKCHDIVPLVTFTTAWQFLRNINNCFLIIASASL